MPSDRENFEDWFVRPLEGLYPKVEQYGFIIVMVTLPLLERYLRQKEKITTHHYKQEFYIALEALFPELRGQNDETREFWTLCRHGLLHRGTFNYGSGYVNLARDLHEPVMVNRADPRNIVFTLDPVAFARKVLTTISEDFEVYASDPTSPPLPIVFPLDYGIPAVAPRPASSASPGTGGLPMGTGLPPKPRETPFPERLRKTILE